MNWKTIRWVLMILLLMINVVLFAYRQYVDDQLYTTSDTQIEELRNTYQAAGFELPEELKQAQYPMAQLILSKEDLTETAEAYFESEEMAADTSYMADNIILYTAGTETVTVDRNESSLTYQESDADLNYGLEDAEEEQIAAAFAETFLCEDPVLVMTEETADGTIYTYCESYDQDLVLFANQIEITVHRGDVTEASMNRYEIQAEADEENTIYHIDEILLSCLDKLGEGEDTELSVFYGYQTVSIHGNSVYCDPVIFVLKPDGTGVMADWFTSEVLSLK